MSVSISATHGRSTTTHVDSGNPRRKLWILPVAILSVFAASAALITLFADQITMMTEFAVMIAFLLGYLLFQMFSG